MVGIVERLRQTRADMLGTPDEAHYWDCVEAAAVIEKLRAATTPICVGRGIIGILAKEGAWTSETGASVVAADELFCNDPYEVIEKLRAALKPFADAAGEYSLSKPNHHHADEHWFQVGDLRAAAAALNDKKNDNK